MGETSAQRGGVTTDAIFRGRLRIAQPEKGLRCTTDPLLLADFVIRTAQVRPHEVCDIGAGSGVVGLVLAAMEPRVRVTGIEIQADLAVLANHNAALNALQDRVQCVTGDVTVLARQGTGRRVYDLVVSNPPYYEQGTGRVSSHPSRAVAHHEGSATLPLVIAAAKEFLGGNSLGRFAAMYPAERFFDLSRALDDEGFCLRGVRMVHPRVDEPASRVLVLAALGSKARTTVYPPLFLHVAQAWSPEASRILDGAFLAP